MTRTGPQWRWWRDAPHLVRRFYWRVFLLPSVVPVLLAAGVATGSVRRLGHVKGTVLLVAVAALTVLWVFAVGRWEQRLVKRLRAADYRICPRCGYDLTGRQGRVNCPECGATCDLEGVRATWRSFRPRITGGTA